MEEEAMAPKIRVLLVEDHEVVRDGLEMLLAQCEGIEVVGTAGTGEEGIRAVFTVAARSGTARSVPARHARPRGAPDASWGRSSSRPEWSS